ncbi:hypothetical protein EJ06DRAFT_474125 [Trichodelitschia bisporula]|uniref:Frequency clock protein n=1 Tax=Trichodelitschia bisporula TaxID=703511 RepID=A0A6G1I2D6_9PEZI|nr:hypothetical protein EJ06DRAFT_474125 [Trichodelitschia bisporula]
MEGQSPPPPGDPRRFIEQHPRRPPAHKSVSLLHTPKDAIPSSQLHPRRQRHGHGHGPKPTPTTLHVNEEPNIEFRPPPQKYTSSGESSNAEKWFEKSNNNVQPGQAALMDNEPPFFLRNSSSSEASPEMNEGRPAHVLPGSSALPYRGAMMNHTETGGSSSEDFRSVIDDLTIQNKKLKRRLKKYEKLHDSHHQQDKLFEIRFHGLPPEKRRELEETLTKFAQNLEETTPPGYPSGNGSVKGSGNGSDRYRSMLKPHLTNSSFTSAKTSAKFGDSAYASLSGGQTSISTAPSGLGSHKKQQSKGSAAAQHQQQQQTIHSYLHDIPRGLLLKNPAAMSEKAKRKLVVRRLEQLFAGKASTLGGHQQPQQQQEVSDSAALADRRAIEASGQLALEEGAREARIMQGAERDALEAPTTGEESPAPSQSSSPENQQQAAEAAEAVPVGQGGEDGSVEQRPTRPLDLDPYRAQVPAENIKYIRHLGFSPPDADTMLPQADGHGWIYLNVLTNMAQLHTISVAPDFVKKAISEHSRKLELSHDGRKVRWRGGKNVTRTSSNGSPGDGEDSPDSLHAAGSGVHGHGKGKRRSELGMTNTDSSNDTLARSEQSGRPTTMDEQPHHHRGQKLDYVPLFSHRLDESHGYHDASDDSMSDWSSPRAPDPGYGAAYSPGFTSSRRTGSPRKRLTVEGPLIFYNQASFITDLSGNPARGGEPAYPASYLRLQTAPLGLAPQPNRQPGSDAKGPLSCRDALATDAMDVDGDAPSTSTSDLEVESLTKQLSRDGSSDDSPVPMEFEASGLGGVHPDDNFSINVRSKREVIDGPVATPSAAAVERARPYSQGIRNVLASKKAVDTAARDPSRHARTFRAEIVSARKRDLPASELPPASFYQFSSPEEDDDDDSLSTEDCDTSSGDDGSPSDDAAHTAHAEPARGKWAPQRVFQGTWSSDSSGSDSEEADEAAAMESEFLPFPMARSPLGLDGDDERVESNLTNGLPGEIPTGSSAATAGGGSGYGSPISLEERAEMLGDGDESMGVGRVPSLKRSRTDDSPPGEGRVSKHERVN